MLEGRCLRDNKAGPRRTPLFGRMSDGRIGADEITVRDGHLRIRLIRMENGWHARIDSDLEGHIFEGHVTELSDLLAGHPAAAAALSALPPDLD